VWSVILSTVHGCDTWAATLREENWPRVFENSVLRRISGPKIEDVTGDWRKLQCDELHNLYITDYYSGDQVRENEMEGVGGKYGRKREMHTKSERRSLKVRAKSKNLEDRVADNINMDLKETGWERDEWSDLAQDKVK
jgi:hypothetical protein